MEGDEDEGEGGKEENQGLLPALDDPQVKDGPVHGQATLLPVGPHLHFTSTHLTLHCVLNVVKSFTWRKFASKISSQTIVREKCSRSTIWEH